MTDSKQSDDQKLWYRDALIYELRIRSFFDSDGDGMGDLNGLTQKLDYLQDLGVTALWLLPFYPSPLRDDGYDIADYSAIHSDSGTMRDFRKFVKEAHRRGLKVITELVLNHTSDQHPWFQKARRGGPNNRWRDFYVWSDTPDPYREARIIFRDFEPSNWTWDPVAKAYFWHRFYSHQPDLNWDNSKVKETMFKIVDYWLDMGVDGMRLDAVPYLFEREGTNCENLPETHQALKDLRAHIDSRFEGRMLLAEANQWPEDASAYFGDGDECQMNFHFPIMPRLFSAIQMEDRFPVIDILDQTPAIPESCQWAIFLRNHDELTLEMVTDEERDYMYRVYAQDRQMRINLGIRRRLAPLLGNNRRKIELMNGMLFSLPGTPVLYYGDEIGMGDNFYLGDRNGVRTPMQWNGDRNAGFSHSNPQKLFLPVIIDPEYHYETVNVEAQQNNQQSLLWWMKRLIALRKRFKAFGRGSIQFLYPDNAKVLSFLRIYQDEEILVVMNLSRFVQFVELDLSAYEGKIPVELFGRNEFPRIGSLPYLLTLAPHCFYWFKLEPEKREEQLPAGAEAGFPQLEVTGEWTEIFSRKNRDALIEVLPRFLATRVWFPSRSKKPKSFGIIDVIPIAGKQLQTRLLLIHVEYTKNLPETYLLPVSFITDERADTLKRASGSPVLAELVTRRKGVETRGVLFDAVHDLRFCQELLNSVYRRKVFTDGKASIRCVPGTGFRDLWSQLQKTTDLPVQVLDQNHTSLFFGDKLVIKFLRRFEEGVNAGLELGRFLVEEGGFPNTPAVTGAVEFTEGRHNVSTVAVLHRYEHHQGTGWEYTLDSLGRYFDTVLSRLAEQEAIAPVLPRQRLLEAVEEPLPDLATDTIGGYLESARLLGQRTAEMHIALASATDDPNLVPEEFTRLYQRSLYQSMRNLTGQTLQQLRERLDVVPAENQNEVRKILALEDRIFHFFDPLLKRKIDTIRTRFHGNFCLEEVLHTGKDFLVIGLEGNRMRPQSEQKIKRSPLRDVSVMLRSFHYAAYCALTGDGARTVAREEDLPALIPWASHWYRWVSTTYLKSYLEVASGHAFLPEDSKDVALLLDVFKVERAVRELSYEISNRPDWVIIPMRGLLQILDVERRASR